MPFSSARSCFLLLAILAPPTSAFLFDLLDSLAFPVLFPRLRCTVALLRLRLDLANFDQYDVYFRDDSVIQLAQSGIFAGAATIEEYVKFAVPAFSPFFTTPSDPDAVAVANDFSFLDYNKETGQCEFLSLLKSSVFLDPEYTDALPEYNGVTMNKIFFDLKERYITRINLFRATDSIRLTFVVAFNSDKTRRFVCEVIKGPCSEIVDATADCEASLAALTLVDGTKNHFDGNSQGCRSLHAVLALNNPEDHCPHLSFSPLKDTNGDFICQTSVYTPPSDLFTDSDFAAFGEFSESVGIDPAVGHDSDA